MHMHSEFNRSVPIMLALVLGCTNGGHDGLGEDDEAGTETTSGDTTSTSTTSTTDTSPTDTTSADTSTTDTTGTDTSTTDTTSTDTTDTGETENANCELNDGWEPNPSAMQPYKVTWESSSEWSAYRIIDDAYLCPGEGDWYHFDVDSLDYTEHFLYIRALVEDAGLCGADCDQPVIPAGPDYAMTVEVYRADSMHLLMSTSQDDGVLPLGGFGDDFSHELLIHVFSPNPKAEYSYRLSVEIRNYDGEDECEC